MKKCKHKARPKLSYTATIGDAHERMARGEKQKQCPVCKLGIWESEYKAAAKPKEPNG